MKTCPSFPLFLILSGAVLGVCAREPGSACPRTLQHLYSDQRLTSSVRGDLAGLWVSDSCEVRPGPEFLTRSYRFYPDFTFRALQFYYQDGQCARPSFSLLARGSVRLLRPSWTVRGATEAELRLRRIQLLSHGAEAGARVRRRLEGSCDLRRPLTPGLEQELMNESWGGDCAAGRDFGLQELRLLRLERRWGRGGAEGAELFLGDVHTESGRPVGFQNPLQNSQGEWVSLRCETRPGVVFLRRQLRFGQDGRSWTGQYRHFSDPLCTHPTFSLWVSGSYTRGASSLPISGAVEFTFTVTRMKVTPLDSATASLLSRSSRGCGSRGSWRVSEQQDVTRGSGCPALGVRLPHTEYELFRAGRDGRGHSLLFNGQRPSDGTSPDRPERRPTAFQSPLVRCSAALCGGHALLTLALLCLALY